MKQKVKVVWFNKNKGFGEGESDSGQVVFLHYKALLDGQKSLTPDQYVLCELKTDENRLVAYSIEKLAETKPTIGPKSPARDADLV